MSHPFIHIAEDFFVSPQITVNDIASAKEAGVSLIINNRPDGEAPGQPDGAAIEEAAKTAGISYLALPVGAAGISMEMLTDFNQAVNETNGIAMGYCASGTRSTILRAFALAQNGGDIDQLIEEANAAGFNIAGLRPVMESLSLIHI